MIALFECLTIHQTIANGCTYACVQRANAQVH